LLQSRNIGFLLLDRRVMGTHAFRMGVAAALLTAPCSAASSQEPGAPVILNGDTLFRVRASLGPFTPEARAAAATDRIRDLASELLENFDSATAVDNGETVDVRAGSTVLLTVTAADAESAGTTRMALAEERARAITRAVRTRTPTVLARTMLLGAGLTVAATFALLLLIRLLRWGFARGIRRIRTWRDTRIPAVRVRSYELFSSAQITGFVVSVVRLLRTVLILVLAYAYISLVFSFFPWTRGIAGQLLSWIIEPLNQVGVAFVTFAPKAFFIAVIVIVTRYVLKLIRSVFNAITIGQLEFPDFPPEWADPTYKLVRLLVIAFAFVVIFPYLPGSHSDAFKGVSVFIGLLLSLGSTGAIANLVAGIVITYMRPFRVGDRVRIADTTGDVVEKTLLVTRVRTIKNEDVTVPNAMVLSSHIVNYSSSARNLGLVLHTTVTIGYNVPWSQVHELLIGAAGDTEGLLREPAPFVLQTSLDDSYVSYQINAYTDRPNDMAVVYSRLHQNIQDRFNAAGVEIMSPHYQALRDGNEVTIPAAHLPVKHEPRGFRIDGRSR
jgi:small-conductance mechanosensitive channel